MKVVFDAEAWDDYLAMQASEPKLLARANLLIAECRRHPFKGIGKPEPLRKNLSGWWSRRINHEHRLVYRVTGSGDEQVLEIIQCRYHY